MTPQPKTVAPTDVERIASGLSSYAKRTLAKSDPCEPVSGSIADLLELCLADLCDAARRGGEVRMNATGLAVRQHLMERSS